MNMLVHGNKEKEMAEVMKLIKSILLLLKKKEIIKKVDLKDSLMKGIL
jgi:hypothetical protein